MPSIVRLYRARPTVTLLITVLCTIAFSILFLRQVDSAKGSAPEWQPYTTYSTGDQVVYQGNTYQCIQGHTSLPGWEPPAVPALWTPISGTPLPTNTPTHTPQAITPSPTNTSTASPPTTTPTTPPGSCTAPAWNASAIYVKGNVVSHNGRQWQAKWWTQGEEPGTTGEWGVWTDLGSCSGTTPTPTTTPLPTNTPMPTNTPGPTPTPCSDCNGDLPDRLLIGYWHNFDNGSGFILLRNVSPSFDVINISFAEPTGAPGNIGFTPYNYTQAGFTTDVAYLRSQGKKVIISIGGANGQVQLTTDTARQNFVNSMISIIETYGFDGMDIDFEGHSLYLNTGDIDINNPTTPVITNLISAIRQIQQHFGSDFILTMAPETFFVQVGYTYYGGFGNVDNRAGAYLPVIHNLRDILSWLQVQHYNSGPIRALDGVYYNMGNSDFHVAMADMVLHGFPVVGDLNNYFPPLRPEQVVIGLPANVNAGNGYTSETEVQRALDYLIKGIPFGGSYTLQNPTGYAAFRGLMTWSINWDAFNNFVFSNSHRTYLDALP